MTSQPRSAPTTIPPEILRRFTLAEQEVALPGFPVTLLKPRNSDDLISEADYAHDERLPYWAELWASSERLAAHLLRNGPAMVQAIEARTGRRPRALELGCGLGLVSIVAQHVGFEALATDYYDDALLFVDYNARRHLGRPIATRMVDWTKMPEDLGHFDLVIAADVLYEMRYAPLLADLTARTLAPDGEVLISDQGRIGMQAYLGECEARGIVNEVIDRFPPAPGEKKPFITIYRLRWRGREVR